MRAAYYEKLGPAKDVLKTGEVAKPAPQAGEVLVRVHASGVNPSRPEDAARHQQCHQ